MVTRRTVFNAVVISSTRLETFEMRGGSMGDAACSTSLSRLNVMTFSAAGALEADSRSACLAFAYDAFALMD